MFGFLTLIDSEVEMFHVCCAVPVVNGGNLRAYYVMELYILIVLWQCIVPRCDKCDFV